MTFDKAGLYLFGAGFFEVDVQGVAVYLSYFAIAEFLVEDALTHFEICCHVFLCNDLAFNGFWGVRFFLKLHVVLKNYGYYFLLIVIDVIVLFSKLKIKVKG